jgi:hypothetical protein
VQAWTFASTSIVWTILLPFLALRAAWEQAFPEHSVVLRPQRGSRFTSVALEFTKPVDPAVAPLLAIEVTNPHFVLLFRFLHDITHGVKLLEVRRQSVHLSICLSVLYSSCSLYSGHPAILPPGFTYQGTKKEKPELEQTPKE